MSMKKFHIIIILSMIIFFSISFREAEPVPTTNIYYKTLYIPETWYATEGPGCPCGNMCYHDMWVPSLEIGQSSIEKRGIWVFGVTNKGKPNGVLHFRKYPDRPCIEHCWDCTPVEYSAEVFYVPWYGGEKPVYSPDEVPLTYIPPGKYLVTSPFTIGFNTKIWYFADDGTGAFMKAFLHADEYSHGIGDTVDLSLQVLTDQPATDNAEIEVDTITGKVVLPDQTEEEITTDMWSWNPDEKHYECTWDKTPQEGTYTVFVTVRKAHYRDVTASTTFMICYDNLIEISFDENPPIYAQEDDVKITVTVKDKDGNPSSVFPIGGVIKGKQGWSLDLDERKKGIWTGSFKPEEVGIYTVKVLADDPDDMCYLRQTAEFEVKIRGDFYCGNSEELYDLVDTYAPYMCFYDGIGEDEKFFPTKVESMLENSTLWKFEDPENLPPRRIWIYQYEGANWAEVLSFNNSPEYYLDLNYEGCTIDPSLIEKYKDDRHVYCRVACYGYEKKYYIVLQYWFFYIFRDHYEDHEGDWEVVEVLLDYDTQEPIGACYSRHDTGEYHTWNEIEKWGTHPVAYIAEGTHSIFFKEGIFGLFYPDHTSDGWKELPSEITILGKDDENEDTESVWLDFMGLWGRLLGKPDPDYVGPFCGGWAPGPHGPKFQGEKWENPVGWAFSHYNNTPLELRSPYTMFSLNCPADMLITNSSGQRLGITNGEFVQEISTSHILDLDEEEFYIVTGKDHYTVEITGTGEGTFDLVCVTSVWDSTRTIKYTDVPVNKLTKAVLHVDLDADLVLQVDSNQDGVIDFTVLPESVTLSSSDPVQPLQINGEMVFEVTLANTGESATFLLDVDTPIPWEYSLPSDTIFLNAGESKSILVRVTSPDNIPVKDYTIRVEATSSKDNEITGDVTLVALSKAELVVKDIEILENGENITISATISNNGIIPAENVTVKFFHGLPSENIILGEQIIDIPSESTATPSITCTLPDGEYTFSVVVDPDNTIPEFYKTNNVLSVQYLLDRTPPEAELFFDITSTDLAVKGVDNLDSYVEISLVEEKSKNKTIRTYTLIDDAENTTEITLEINHKGKEIKAHIIRLIYNNEPVTIPNHHIKIEYIVEKGEVKKLNQFLIIENTHIHLIYHRNKNITKIINETEETQEGLLILILQTQNGEFYYKFEDI
ncbi:MAG: CARDB domain-containing protein [Candidatus Methanofastidiosia archaeon]